MHIHVCVHSFMCAGVDVTEKDGFVGIIATRTVYSEVRQLSKIETQ